MSTASAILTVHALSTAAMAGMVWFAQVVHYPLFLRVPADVFRDYEQRHHLGTAAVAGPVMLAELAAATAILFNMAPSVPRSMAIGGFLLIGAVWASTFLVQVPLLRVLAASKSDTAIRALVASNWVRTALWTARAVLAVLMLARSTGGV